MRFRFVRQRDGLLRKARAAHAERAVPGDLNGRVGLFFGIQQDRAVSVGRFGRFGLPPRGQFRRQDEAVRAGDDADRFRHLPVDGRHGDGGIGGKGSAVKREEDMPFRHIVGADFGDEAGEEDGHRARAVRNAVDAVAYRAAAFLGQHEDEGMVGKPRVVIRRGGVLEADGGIGIHGFLMGKIVTVAVVADIRVERRAGGDDGSLGVSFAVVIAVCSDVRSRIREHLRLCGGFGGLLFGVRFGKRRVGAAFVAGGKGQGGKQGDKRQKNVVHTIPLFGVDTR